MHTPHSPYPFLQILGSLLGFNAGLRDFGIAQHMGDPSGETAVAPPVCVVGGRGLIVGAPGTRERVAEALVVACRCARGGGGRG